MTLRPCSNCGEGMIFGTRFCLSCGATAPDRQLSTDWAEVALMHRLCPFTLEDFDILVAAAARRGYSEEDRHDAEMLDDEGTVNTEYLTTFWGISDLLGGTE